MSANLFRNEILPSAAFVASRPFSIVGNKIVLNWSLVVTTGTTQVQWFFEFVGPHTGSDDPNAAATTWFREMDEVDAGGGVVNMSEVIRALHTNAGVGLTVGTHTIHMEFERIAAFGRVQARIVAGGGAVRLTLDEELGSTPQTAPA